MHSPKKFRTLMFRGTLIVATVLFAGCISIRPMRAEDTKTAPTAQDAPSEPKLSPALKRQLDKLDPAERARVMAEITVKYTAAKKENFCSQMLDAEAATVYDEAGLKKLLAAPKACPTDVPLTKTLEYVNTTLFCSFDDPYDEILSPEEAADLRNEFAGTKQAFKGGGIGLEITNDYSKRLPLVVAPAATGPVVAAKPELDICTGLPLPPLTPDPSAKPLGKLAFTGMIYHAMTRGPAYKAGFRDGDIVTTVDGQSVIGLDADHVVNDLLRGDLNTKVTVTVQRGKQEITATLTRAAALPDNVWSRDLGDGVYSIVIENFAVENTAGQVLDLVKKLEKEKKAKHFALDVRNNPGGKLDEAIWAASLFVHDGVIVSQRERVQGDPATPQYINITWYRKGGKLYSKTVDESSGKVLEDIRIKLTFQATDEKTGKPIGKPRIEDVPYIGRGKKFAVVANGMSASAAEVFTGALAENIITDTPKQDDQGASSWGVHSFGKFIGQTVFGGPLNTAIKATSFRYFSPKGEWLGDAYKHRTGLTPQHEVKQPDNAVPYTATDAQMNAVKDFLLHGGAGK
jgi:C-terminal processing protease CtpA/Prc